MKIKQFQRSAALAGSLVLAAFGAQAANDFTVQNGTWVVTSEVDGHPGRGMAIDVQDGMLVLAVYNYESSGQPTFHLASGTMSDNHFSGALTRYKNGRYFGSGPLDAVADGSAGTVQIDFTSAYTGTIQFPGEPSAVISRLKFDGIDTGLLARKNITAERWLIAELEETTEKPVNALLVQTATTGFSPGPMNVPTLSRVQSFLDGEASQATCKYNGANEHFTCEVQFGGITTKRTLEFSKHLESMSGTISYWKGNLSPAVPGKRKLVGMRLGIDFSMGADGTQMDAPSATDLERAALSVTPDPGMWVISSELVGKPGRGISMDVQYDASVMLTYNYEATGAPTFHMGNSTYAHGQASGHLIRYEGGRYFGGPAQSAHDVADVGEVKLSFSTPTKGTVQFPGEAPVQMQRYQFGATQPSAESLFGGWMIFDPEQHQLRYYSLNGIYSTAPPVATGTGALLTIRCSYPGGGAEEAVKCRDQTPSSIDDYLFTPVNGRAIGTHENGSGSSTVYVLRVKDRHGRLAGLGKF